MHQTLYRKYRPATFTEVVGQEHIVPVLEYEVSSGKTTHAYLFCGSRGTGKTSCAKILAKAVNCLSPVNGSPCGECEACRMIENGTATDVVEMDAASNTGVDYIRDIKDVVAYPPTMLKNRVYIIDEVHMLSQGAFNALLKTLEEPPPHVIFILATTELQKVPATILSRCQRFDFHRIPIPVLIGRLREIAGKEQITVTEDALLMMARNARGGMRDAISLLELCAGSGEEITAELVREKIGIGGREMLETAFLAIHDHDYNAVFSLIDSLYGSAIDISAFWQELIGFCRDLLVVRSVSDPTRFIDATAEEFQSLSSIAAKFSKEKLVWIGNVLDEAQNSMQRTSDSKRVIAEMALIRLCDERMSDSTSALVARIAALEEKLDAIKAGAVFSAPPKKEIPPEPIPAAAETEEKTSPQPEIQKEAPAASEPEPSASETAFDMLPELVEKVGHTDEAAATLLRMAGIFVCGNKLKIKVGDMFSGMLLGEDDRKKLIAESFRTLPGFAGISDNDIVIEVAPKKEEADPFADIG